MKSQDEQWLLSEKYDGEKSAAFYADCKTLALGTPLGYLIGHVPFLNCTIYLDEQPLIPRAETEYWVEQAIGAIREGQELQPDLFVADSPVVMAEHPQRQSPERGRVKTEPATSRPAANLDQSPKPANPSLVQSRLSPGGFVLGGEGVMESGSGQLVSSPRVLDVCAGSGCIGVSVAKAIPSVLVDFSELSQRLIPTIKKNCEKNEIAADRYIVYHSNLFQSIPIDTTYDFILCNPPYIDPAVDRAEESVKSYEPHLALYGGVGGMEIIEQLITAAPAYLVRGGQLWIEHEPEQAAAINSLARELNFAVTNHQDQYQVTRYSILVLQ